MRSGVLWGGDKGIPIRLLVWLEVIDFLGFFSLSCFFPILGNCLN